MIIGTDAIQRLHEFLKEEESMVEKDGAGIYNPQAVDHKIITNTIKRCIKKISDEPDRPTQET